MSADDIEKCLATLARGNPRPRTELKYANTYQLLVAVVLSAQATDKGVNAAAAGLFRKVKKPQQMLQLGEAGLIEHIKSIGLFRTKAKNVIALSGMLIELHSGRVPKSRAELEKLPGVGRKTANVVLNCAFGMPTMAVDTHIFRVANRTGLGPGKDVRAVEEALLANLPEKYLQHAHHWLILHGRYTCQARKPRCGNCPIRIWCKWPDKGDWS